MGEKNNYKHTLNLPQTPFDMRAGLLKKEPAIQDAWREQGLNEQIRAARKGGRRFVLHDGPPYANGEPHMGHVLNKVLKDVVVRLKTMSGLDTGHYIHGWDCHGQPIEQKIVEQLGEKMHSMPAEDIRPGSDSTREMAGGPRVAARPGGVSARRRARGSPLVGGGHGGPAVAGPKGNT